MKIPVAFILFNRSDTTAKVFEAIRNAKPPKLFVIADGPRAERSGESEKCQATREIIKQVDWDCEVLTNYSDVNLGCKQRVSSGLDWVFNQVEEAIILEDDCLPDPTFFRFCEELLEKYRDDERIMSICGSNFQLDNKSNKNDYYYSRFHDSWGWATWRRAWHHCDVEMKYWTQFRDSSFLINYLCDSRSAKYWTNIFQSTYDKKINSWYFTWLFSCWAQNGLGIFPCVNLVSNIGCRSDATHTTSKTFPYAKIPLETMKFPLTSPLFFLPDYDIDNFIQKTRYDPSLKSILIHKFIVLLTYAKLIFYKK